MDLNRLHIYLGLFLTLILAGCVQQQNSVSYNDVEIKDLKYSSFSNTMSIEPVRTDETGNIQVSVQITLSSQQDKLFYQFYGVAYTLPNEGNLGFDLNGQPLFFLSRGENIVGIIALSPSLRVGPTIEVCFSQNYFSQKSEAGVVCKQQTFKPPNLDFSVTPSLISFTVNKSLPFFNEFGQPSSPKQTQTMTIKNTGELPLEIFAYVQDVSTDSSTPKNAPSYYGVSLGLSSNFGFNCPNSPYAGSCTLKPGDSGEYSLTAVGESDTPLGMYSSVVYFYAIPHTYGQADSAELKKSFTIQTTVVS